ncbi:MAG: ribbon-helix-helix domain-containing protein [Patescibacteria group bacterium]|nr:ribbon-helix-helix domain-containing protein [Patescibacteria group bacterium]
MAKGENFSVYMTPELKNEIDYFVDLKNNASGGKWTRSSFMRASIDEYIKKCKLEFSNEISQKREGSLNK